MLLPQTLYAILPSLDLENASYPFWPSHIHTSPQPQDRIRGPLSEKVVKKDMVPLVLEV